MAEKPGCWSQLWRAERAQQWWCWPELEEEARRQQAWWWWSAEGQQAAPVMARWAACPARCRAEGEASEGDHPDQQDDLDLHAPGTCCRLR